MHTHNNTTEDTMIGSQRAAVNLFDNSTDSNDGPSGLFERCRTMFRTLGEQMTSFELSRQIYGY